MSIEVSIATERQKFYLEETNDGDWELWSTIEDPSGDTLVAVFYDETLAEQILDLLLPKVFNDPEDEEDYEDDDDDEYGEEEVDEFIAHNKKGMSWDNDV